MPVRHIIKKTAYYYVVEVTVVLAAFVDGVFGRAWCSTLELAAFTHYAGHAPYRECVIPLQQTTLCTVYCSTPFIQRPPLQTLQFYDTLQKIAYEAWMVT